MKKVIYFAVVASVAFASCTKNEVRTVEDNQDRQITFQAVVHKASTKATTFDNNVAYPTDATFGTFAYFNNGSATFPTDVKVYINNAEVEHIDATTANETTPVEGWTTNPAYYWPKQGSLTFFSYSPYSISSSVSCNTTSGIIITDWNVDENQTVDVMVADRKTNMTQNGSNAGWVGVPTIFRHKLAQVVDFKIKTTADYSNLSGEGNLQAGSKQFYINELSINTVKFKGTFTSGLEPSNTTIGSWVNDANTKKYIWYASDDNTEANKFGVTEGSAPKSDDGTTNSKVKTNGYLLVIPQTFSSNTNASDPNLEPSTGAAYIKFVYTIRTYYSSTGYTDEKVTVYKDFKSLNASGWEINKRYTYTISVSLDQIYWAPSVENWEDTGASSITF